MTMFTPGVINYGVYTKRIWQRNILRIPEPSFTIDKDTYDGLREQFNAVRIIVRETGETYDLPAEAFDALKVIYDFGTGAGYFVPVRKWKLTSKQLTL